MNDLTPIITAICGFGTLCFAAVIGVGIIASVFGIQLFRDYFREDEDDEAWNRQYEIEKPNLRSRTSSFKPQTARDDFDARVEQFKRSSKTPTVDISSSPDFASPDAEQKSLRGRDSRNRRSMADREDELFGGMLEDDDFI